MDVLLMGLAGATMTAGAELTLSAMVEECADLFWGVPAPVPLGEVLLELGLRGTRMRVAASRVEGEDGGVRAGGSGGVTGDVLLGDPSMAANWVTGCYLAFAAAEAAARGGDPGDVAVTDSRLACAEDGAAARRLAPFVLGVRAARDSGQDLAAARLAARFNEGEVPPGAENSPSVLFLRLNTYIVLLALNEAERRGEGGAPEAGTTAEEARFLDRLVLAFIACQARSVACLRIFVELCVEAVVERGMRYADLLEGVRASGRAADACLRLQACGNLATMDAQGGAAAIPLDVTLGMLSTWFTLVETICLGPPSEADTTENLAPDLARARKSAQGMALQLGAALRDNEGNGATLPYPEGPKPRGFAEERTSIPAAVPGQGLYGMTSNPWLARTSPAFAFMAVCRGIVEITLALEEDRASSM